LQADTEVQLWSRKTVHIIGIEILLNGDVPRRNGNVMYNVNRPAFVTPLFAHSLFLFAMTLTVNQTPAGLCSYS